MTTATKRKSAGNGEATQALIPTDFASDKTVALRPSSFEEYVKIAETMAKSDLVPKDYKGKPANCLIAMQMGAELGLPPMSAIQNIAVINGRPSLWGDAVLALLKSSPVWDEEAFEETFEGEAYNDDFTAVCTMRRRGGKIKRHTFSVLDAKKAELWTKQGPWKQYPKRMLQLRARGFTARDVFPDLLKGLSIAEEVRDIEDTTYEVVDDTSTEKKTRTESVTERVTRQKPVKKDVAEAKVIDNQADSGEVMTDAQLKAIHAVGKQKGHDHEGLSKYAKSAYGVESLKDLTRKQAAEMIAGLQKMEGSADGQLPLT